MFIEKSTSDWRSPSSEKLSVKKAEVVRDGAHYIIEFEDGEMTQGRNRAEALVMAADLRACCDERDAIHYWARWVGQNVIEVLVA